MKKRTSTAALAGCVSLLAVTGCSSGFGGGDTAQEDGGKQNLTVLIASSGTAETQAVEKATAGYEKKSGNEVTVQTAKDMNQQLGQAFAGGSPPDVFYVNSDQFANYASGGSLYPYGDEIENVEDFPETLRRSFTYDGKLTCVPKDAAALALAINTKLWQDAGLTEKDYPKSWDELESVAKKLTKGTVTGLVTSEEYQRLGAFMKEAGGWITNADQTKMTADSQQNTEALAFVKKGLQNGWWKWAKDVDSLNAGEAFGQGKAAMTIEGSWLAGQLQHDFPTTDYKVVGMPEGPAGKGNLAFTTCWGVAQKSTHRAAAVDLVQHLAATEQQAAMGEGFGAIPARESAADEYFGKHPDREPWTPIGEGIQGPVTIKGMDKVLSQFNSDLLSLKTADPKKILSDLQRNGEPVIQESTE
ncbi:extracellular solute-binding protein [Nonomuraea sp. K274]|uniref:Extracellular solute-binding protein n=1 Tax=Nonomuraea cypriaca TaxID=1187855 RepID=A0A931AKW9_9ACTN|nr:extracellular solute-binding protein [Nonomuraea cypriaca]MBF8193828.1 extracellular solute-binding protein [Nonomuraea cypriaca]